MKTGYFFIVALFLLSCNKHKVQPQTDQQVISQSVQCQTASVISYSSHVLPLFQNNCNNCHASPGAGGIKLDSYSSIKEIMLSGQVMAVVTNTDINAIIMPPPRQRHLDSCEIKTLNIWLAQGCSNN